jgi:hypothetical protein
VTADPSGGNTGATERPQMSANVATVGSADGAA